MKTLICVMAILGNAASMFTDMVLTLRQAKDGYENTIDAWFVRPELPIRIKLSGDRFSVANSCNILTGRFEWDDSHFVAGPLISTRMACDPEIMNLDKLVGDLLSAKPAVTATPDQATFRTEDGSYYVFDMETQTESAK